MKLQQIFKIKFQISDGEAVREDVKIYFNRVREFMIHSNSDKKATPRRRRISLETSEKLSLFGEHPT